MNKKRIGSILLAVVVLFSILPITNMEAKAAGTHIVSNITEMLDAVSKSADGDTIYVKSDFNIPSNIKNSLSSTAYIVAKKSLTFEGYQGKTYKITREGGKSILEANGKNVNVILRNLVFDGGAIWNDPTAPSTRKNSGVSGRSIIDVAGQATLNVETGTIIQNGLTDNSAATNSTDTGSQPYGGGIRVDWKDTNAGGTVNLRSGSVIQYCGTSNNSSGGYGGGIGAYNDAKLNAYGGTIQYCYSNNGGAIGATYRATVASNRAAVINMSGGVLRKNAGKVGGALQFEGATPSKITGGTIQDNTATEKGGAIALTEKTTVELGVSNLVLSGNSLTGNNFETSKYNGLYKNSNSTYNITNTYKVSFDSKGGNPVGDLFAPENGALGEAFPGIPQRQGYIFEGWYMEETYQTPFTKDTSVTSNITVYAKWKQDTVITKNPTPNAVVDSADKVLKGLTPSAVYVIGGTDYTADANGQIPLKEAWYGTSISLVQKGDGIATSDSDAQTLPISMDIKKAEEAAKEAAHALLAMTATNATTSDDVINEVKKVVDSAISVTWKPDDGFDKNNATTSTTGRVTGTIIIKSGDVELEVPVNLPIATLAKNPTPNAVVDVAKDVLGGLTPGATYIINGTEFTADENGQIGIKDTWYGTSVSVVQKGDGVMTGNSDAQMVSIPLEGKKEDAKAEINQKLEETSDKIDALESLTDEEKQQAKDELKKAADEAKKAIDDATSKDALDNAVDTGKGNLDSLVELEEKKDFDNVVDAAQNEVDQKAAEAKADIDKLEKLDEARKEEIKKEINKKVEDAKQAMENAATKEEVADNMIDAKGEIDSIVAAAKQEELANEKTNAEAVIKQKAENAKEEVNGIPGLTEEEKQAVKDAIDNKANEAITGLPSILDKEGVKESVKVCEEAIDEFVAEAQELALSRAKEKAKEEINKEVNDAKEVIDALANLTEEEKTFVKDAIDEIKNTVIGAIDVAVDQDMVKGLLSIGKKGIDDAVAIAISQDIQKVKEAAKAVINKKAEEAKAAVEAMKNLTKSEKAEYNAKIDEIAAKAKADLEAKTVISEINPVKDGAIAAINKVVGDANAKNKSNDGNSGNTNQGNGQNNSPAIKTGDTTNTAPIIFLFVSGILAAGYILTKKRS